MKPIAGPTCRTGNFHFVEFVSIGNANGSQIDGNTSFVKVDAGSTMKVQGITQRAANVGSGISKTGPGELLFHGGTSGDHNGSCTGKSYLTEGTLTICGSDYDKLDILGTLIGLNATAANALVDLVVTVSPGLDLTNDTFTILDSTSNLTGLNFRTITWNGTDPGTVSYNADGTVVLSNLTSVPIPEPTALSGMVVTAGLLARRRRGMA